ncbi:hypothetical protein K3495_g6644 [Podosphaera aphanis]|nr:hypothetical protein K3495_g6644 [Podosphaera aphanis]
MSTHEILKSLRRAPELNKTNYMRWSKLFIQVLTNLQVEGYVTGGLVSEPSAPTTDDKKQAKIINSSNSQDGNIKAALFQLVPETLFYLIEDRETSKEMWDAIQEYFLPYCYSSINSMLEDFWRFSMDEGTDVDVFAEELIKRQTKITSVDKSQRPSDLIMKNRILDHFDGYRDGHYSGTATMLRNDPNVTFFDAVNSLRASQVNYKRNHPDQVIAFAQGDRKADAPLSTNKVKTCAHCKRKGHIRESCFIWLDTPDGSKWAAKNPEKAAKVRKLKEKRNEKKSERPPKVSLITQMVMLQMVSGQFMITLSP